jgi:hypothetical protein
VTRLGAVAARGDALQIQRGNQLFDERALQGEWQREGLDLHLQGGEEKGEGGQHLGTQTLRLGQAFTGARRQISSRGDTPEPRPDVVEALRDLFDGLCLSALQVIRVIQDTQLTHQFPGFALTRLRLGVREFGLHHLAHGGVDAGGERGRATAGTWRLLFVRLQGRRSTAQRVWAAATVAADCRTWRARCRLVAFEISC